MSDKDFKEISELLRSVLDCKTQPNRKLAIEMIISMLKEKVKP